MKNKLKSIDWLEVAIRVLIVGILLPTFIMLILAVWGLLFLFLAEVFNGTLWIMNR